MPILTGIEADARLGTAAISSSNFARVSVSGFSVSSLDVAKRVAIGGVGASGATLQTTVSNVVNASTFDIADAATLTAGAASILIGTDNAAVIQGAIDNNREVEIPSPGSGDIACGPINLTAPTCYTLTARGCPFSRAVWLHPFCDSGTFIDAYGRSSIRIEGVQIGHPGNPNRPDVGLLIGGPSDHLYLRHIGMAGLYRKAALDACSGGTGAIENCAIWNSGTGYAWAWDLDNSLGATSHVTIGGPYALSPWKLSGNEAHSGSSGVKAMLIRGLDDADHRSFIYSGLPGQDSVIRVEDPSGQDGMRRNIFTAGRFEAEQGSPVHIFDMAGNGSAYFTPGTTMYGQTGAFKTGSGTASFSGQFPS